MVAIQCPVLGCDIQTTNLIRIRLHSAIGFDKNFNLIPNTSFFQNRMVKDWFSKLYLGKGCKSWETGSVNTSRFLRTSHNYVSKSFFYFCHQKFPTLFLVLFWLYLTWVQQIVSPLPLPPNFPHISLVRCIKTHLKF